jgi:hypothetical protein
VDVARLRTDCGCGQFADMDNSWLRLRSWTGHGHGLTAGGTRTQTGCGHGLDQDKDADWTRRRSRRGCGLAADRTTMRTSAWILRGLCPVNARTLRGRKNLILMRSKACPGKKYRMETAFQFRWIVHASPASRRMPATFASLDAVIVTVGTVADDLGGMTPNHSFASSSVVSSR